MPKSGFCSVCYARVWLADDGSCANGHAPWAVSDARDTTEGADDAPGGPAAAPPSVTIVPPPNVIQTPVDLTVPSIEIETPWTPEPPGQPPADEAPASRAGTMPAPEDLAESAARLISMARQADGAQPAALLSPDVADAVRTGGRRVRTLMIAALVLTAGASCCCWSAVRSLSPDGDTTIESTGQAVTPPVTPPAIATGAVATTAAADATNGAYTVVTAADAPFTVTDVALGTTVAHDDDPVLVTQTVSATRTADITLSFTVPEGVPDGTMFSARMRRSASGESTLGPPVTAGPATLEPGSAVARFDRPEGGWAPFSVCEIRLLADDRLLATAFFATTE